MKRQLLAFGVGLVAAGLVLSPVRAHVGGTVSHLWNDHLFEKVDDTFLQKFDARDTYLKQQTRMWARINPDGSIFRGFISGADPTGTSKLSKGIYRVAFDYDVDECSVTATAENSMFLANAHTPGGDEVEVRLFDLTIEGEDKSANGAFSVQVLC